MAMSPSELWRLELGEFLAIYDGWRHRQEYAERQEWERTRWHACAIISPWLKDSRAMTELLPLPWDEKQAEVLDYDPTDMDARAEHVKELYKQIYGREVSESID